MKIIDMHCDTIMALMGNDKELRKSDNMIDIEKLQEGNYLLQCFAMFVPYKSRKNEENYSPFEFCHKMIDRYYEELKKNTDYILPAFTYSDIERNIRNNKLLIHVGFSLWFFLLLYHTLLIFSIVLINLLILRKREPDATK